MEAATFPLNEKVLLHRGVAVFQSQITLTASFARDCDFLSRLKLENCFYGACDCEIYPFFCVPKQRFEQIPTAAQVLCALHVANFQSDFIATLETRHLPFAGYHPVTHNDEIHTNENQQYLFGKAADIEGPNSSSLSWNSHQSLKNYVVDKHLFYVLIHDKEKQDEAFQSSEFVLL